MSAADDPVGQSLMKGSPPLAHPAHQERSARRARRDTPALSLQAAIDAFPEEIAVLDDKATVLSSNEAWLRSPGPRNTGRLPPPGESYLRLWLGSPSRQALAAAAGIRSVIRGSKSRFICQFR